MKKGSYWFSLLTEKQQSEFRANVGERFYEIMNRNFRSFYLFIDDSFLWEGAEQGDKYWSDIAASNPIVHTHFHIVYLTGENKCTGVNIQAVDMIDALKQFESKNNGVKPIYCYAK